MHRLNNILLVLGLCATTWAGEHSNNDAFLEHCWEGLRAHHASAPRATGLPTTTEDYRRQQAFVGVSLPPAIQTAAQLTGENRRYLWNTLVTYVNQVPYHAPKEGTTILSLGCGRAEDAIVLRAFFGDRPFGSPGQKARYIGIDAEEKAIEGARLMNDSHEPQTTLIKGDATDLSRILEVPKQVDVVMLRHQQISASKEVWGKMLEEGYARLRPGGILICTSYSDVEDEMLQKELSARHLPVVLNEANRYAFPLSHPSVSVDRRVTIVQKPE